MGLFLNEKSELMVFSLILCVCLFYTVNIVPGPHATVGCDEIRRFIFVGCVISAVPLLTPYPSLIPLLP